MIIARLLIAALFAALFMWHVAWSAVTGDDPDATEISEDIDGDRGKSSDERV